MTLSNGKHLLLGLEVVEIIFFSALAVDRLSPLEPALTKALAAAAAALYFSWIIWEMAHVTVRDLGRVVAPVPNQKGSSQKRTSMELASLAKICVLGSSFGLTSTIDPGLAGFGFVVLLAGVVLRVYAIRTLGPGYSHHIALVPQNIVAKGPYRFIRHPAFLGTLIAHTGLVIVYSNSYSLASLLFWLIAVVQRTLSEESFSQGHPVYRTYAQAVRYRLIPYIW